MEFPWYGPLEGIDWSNWPIWLICFFLAFVAAGVVAAALLKAMENS
jgi:hypothetical protein